ncbi:MAG: ABC transporter ATP-binding protein [Streptosporangiaceae bacterium]
MNLTMRFPGRDRPSVDRLDLTVAPGQIFGLLGPNGSGKTTTINLITGLMTPSRGTVQVFGRQPQHARRLMGVVTQETSLYDQLTARFNLGFHAWLYGYRGRERRERVDAALRLANLTGQARQRAGTLSGGMARRLAIARALLHSPALIILDEPTLGVDPVERAVLWDHIRALRDEGTTVLLTTNLMEEASALADRVAILRDGRLAAPVDTPVNLQWRFGGTVITVLAAAATETIMQDACRVLAQDPGVPRAEVTAGEQPGVYRLDVTTATRDGITGRLITLLTSRGARICDITARTPSLDEAFRELTGGFRAVR